MTGLFSTGQLGGGPGDEAIDLTARGGAGAAQGGGAGASGPDVRRPNHIAKTEPDILSLLELAEEHDWVVRLSCAEAPGGPEVVVFVNAVSGDRVLAMVAETGARLAVRAGAILWARVLTDAEEILFMDGEEIS